MNRRRRKESLKNQIWQKTGGVCAKCGKAVEPDKRTIDHFIPKYHGGTDDIRNLIPMCKACNRAKGSRLMSIEDCCPYLSEEYRALAIKYSGERLAPFGQRVVKVN